MGSNKRRQYNKYNSTKNTTSNLNKLNNMNPTPTIRPLFLNLLSAAIWDKPADVALFDGLDTQAWEGIVDMARRQSVSALIADKALSLPKDSLPPRKLNLQFMVMIEQTETLNRKMIGVLKVLMQEYKANNYPFCLLKGLSNGINYPKPLLRNAGDLDMFLYQNGDYKKSKEWIMGKGFEIDDGHHMHYSFDKGGIHIENHCRVSYFDHTKYDILFKEWEAELMEKKNFTTVQIEGLTVQQLPVEMNAFFIFQHMFRHFVHLGVGFRQYCDWLLFLSKHRDEIDPTSFTTTAQSYALLYPMQVFARAAVKYLHARQSIFPFDITVNDQLDEHADWIMADILNSGNFGFHKPGKQRPKEKLRGMWFSYKTTIGRSIKFGAISPEHIKVLPYKKLIHRFKIGFK